MYIALLKGKFDNNMEVSMDLSVIIPCFNAEQYILTCLNSIKALSSLSYEIIVIDDGSTDSTLKHIKSFGEQYTGEIIIVSQPNKGTAYARNVGLNLASGKYVLFLDADDCVYPDELELLVKEIVKDDVEMGMADYYKAIKGKIYIPESVIRREKRLKKVSKMMTGIEYAEKVYEHFRNYITSEVAFCIINKGFIDEERIKFDENSYHEDTLFFFKCIIKADKVKHYNILFYQYNIYEASKARNINSENIRIKDKLLLARKLMNIKNEINECYYFLDSYIINLLYYARKHSREKPFNADYNLCRKLTLKSLIMKYCLKLQGYL